MPSSTETIATADPIGDYAVSGQAIVWTARHGGEWQVVARSAPEAPPVVLWHGAIEPRAVLLSDGKVFWTETLPPRVADSGPFPPLASTIGIYSAPLSGGREQMVGRILEEQCDALIGIHGDGLLVSTTRPGSPGVTAIYQVNVSDGRASRLVAETGLQKALMTRDGGLYWSSASEESNQSDKVICVKRRSPDGRIDSLTDWLPADGRLFETDRGIVYVDGTYMAAAYFLAGPKDLPAPISIPDDYIVLAVGQQDMLLQLSGAAGTNQPVYRMDLP